MTGSMTGDCENLSQRTGLTDPCVLAILVQEPLLFELLGRLLGQPAEDLWADQLVPAVYASHDTAIRHGGVDLRSGPKAAPCQLASNTAPPSG